MHGKGKSIQEIADHLKVEVEEIEKWVGNYSIHKRPKHEEDHIVSLSSGTEYDRRLRNPPRELL